jgi:hypothetical protein
MKFIVSLFYLIFLMSLSNLVENKRIYSITSDKEDMSDFLNAIFDINEGSKILRKCRTTYTPSRKSHQNFVDKYNSLFSSLSLLVESKKYPEINGKECEYDSNNIKNFDNNSDELESKEVFDSLFLATFARSFSNFIKCIGKKELIAITNNPDFVEEVFFFGEAQNITKLFRSTCSINNIISKITEIDGSESDAFKKIGTQLHSIFDLVRKHFEYLK